MNQFKIHRRAVVALCAALVLSQAIAQANFPTAPVRIVVPFPPGGAGDSLARVVGTALSAKWGQPVYIENRPGAGTTIGANVVAKAKPDGYTLGVINSSYTANPGLLRANMPFDTLKETVGVAPLAAVRMMFLVNPTVPVNSLAELVELSKTKSINYGSPGVGSSAHLAGEFLGILSDSKLTHIAYKGSAPAIVELLAGRIEVVIDAYTASNAQHVKAGKLKLIAVSGEGRAAEFPTVPLAQQSYRELEIPGFLGLIAPAALPGPLLEKLNRDVVSAVRSPDVARQIVSLGLDTYPLPSDTGAFNALLRVEIDKWSKVIKAANIQPE
jgi:tripartite-type tricarboxylate transporter receptor subunit TctC